ncbi:PAS/PAC sensor signal transduction histidine kinase [Halobiforma haloterrestris]|uniref:histidine kinase n=2 Tax=Natronobacterium haloterrestre TaxID=148448 RepID=A0A1I1F5W9_NATHA|nr:PAS/PAC sensor signal transduction histidine kinase [Halobiforma haloterrestris]
MGSHPMGWQFTARFLPLFVAATLAVILCVLAVRNRQRDERAVPLVVGVLLGAGIWAGADALRLARTDLAAKFLLHNVRFVGSTLLVLSTLLFTLEYTNRDEQVTTRTAAALGAPFLVTLGLVWTDHTATHDLIRTSVELVVVDGLAVAEFEFGPAFYLNAAYSYTLLGTALALYLLEMLRTQGRVYRRQCATLVTGMLVPWVLNALYLRGTTVVDLTGVGLVVTGIAFYASLFWFQLLDLGPIARSTVVDEIEHGVVVVDAEGRVVDVNETAVSVFGRSRVDLVGSDAGSLPNSPPDLAERLAREEPVHDEVTVSIGDGARHFTVDVSPIAVRDGRHAGHVVLFRDVTEQRQRQRELERRTEQLETQTDRFERQNERLDRFASILSHDLRNPLTVARGYVETMDEDRPPDPERLAAIEESLDRMDEIVDDVRTLVRQESEPTDREPVDLRAVATDAWNGTATKDASLVVETDRTVRADRSRLRQLLENLFRNAIDHGPDDVTVHVGDLEDGGFYVADDGPGIPESERGAVFEEGYSTSEVGTGLGLAIVSSVADAHGWSIEPLESDGGGARFEVVTGNEDGDADADTESAGTEPPVNRRDRGPFDDRGSSQEPPSPVD